MAKRLISFLLALVMVVGLLPVYTMAEEPTEAADENYTKNIRIIWTESGVEKEWTVHYDYELSQEFVSSEYPAGVSYEAGVLTLENANLSRIDISHWGDTPFRLVIKGENTLSTGNFNALRIESCHNISISGGGILNASAGESVFYVWDVFPYSEDIGYRYNENGLLTISDVTLNVTNNRSGDDYNADNSWVYSAMIFHGNVKMDNVTATVNGSYSQNGDLTLTNSTLDLTGITFFPASDDTGSYYLTSSRIENSTLTLTPFRLSGDWHEFAFTVGPGTDVTIGEGANITVDMSDGTWNHLPMKISDDYMGIGKGGTLNMTGGKMKLIMAPGQSRGITIPGKAEWNLTGGDVTIQMSSGIQGATDGDLCAAIEIANGSTFTQSGGTMTITNTPDSNDGLMEYNIHGIWAGNGSAVTLSGGELICSGIMAGAVRLEGDLALTGGTMNLEVSNTALDLGRRSSVTLLDGELNIKTSDADVYTISLWENSSFRVFGGELNVQSSGFGMLLYQGHARFDGGSSTFTAKHALYADNGSTITFGEGINAVDTEGTFFEIEYGDHNDSGIVGNGAPISITRQGAPAEANRLLLECQQPYSVMTGLAVPMQLAAVLTTPSGTIHIALPDDAIFVENSVYRGNALLPATVSGDGFDVAVNSGDVITFGFVPAHAESCAVTASYEDTRVCAELLCRDYTLSIPSAVNTNTIPLSGTGVAGSTLTFYANSRIVGTAKANAVGTWSTTLTLPDEEGTYSIYAVITGADGSRIAVSDVYRLTYLKSGPAVKTLTISNWIHGNTQYDPDYETSVVIDYENGTRSANYYTYWPELPEFTFEVAFQGNSGSDQLVSDVTVVATDWQGVEDTVPLGYNAETGTWIGTHDFCSDGNIVPDQFRVEWMSAVSSPAGAISETAESEEESQPAQTETDSSTGGFQFAEAAGPITIPLAEGSQISSLTNGAGDGVSYVLSDAGCNFRVESGESYFITLSSGSFSDHPGQTKLTVLVGGSPGTDTAEYKKGVLEVDSSVFTSMTDTTFVSDNAYFVDDVLVIDGTRAIVITAAEGSTYTYETAGLDQVYRHLDVSTIDTSQPLTVDWNQTEAAVAAEIQQSALYTAYINAVEAAAEDYNKTAALTFQIDNTSASVEMEYGWKDGNIHLAPSITLETEMTTKFPGSSQSVTTTVAGKITFSIDEAIQYRIRSMDDDKVLQSYQLSVDETIGLKLEVSASVGDDGSSPDIDAYFSGFDEDVKKKFLQELEESDKENTLPLLKDMEIHVPTPVPAVTVVVSPSIKLDWSFFGEISTSAELTMKSHKGISLCHIGDNYLSGLDDWSLETYCKKEDPTFTLGLGLHASASAGLMFGCEVGLSALTSLDLTLYGKAGPKFTLEGHGTAEFNGTSSPETKAELSAAVALEVEYGAEVELSLGKLPIALAPLSIPLYQKSMPLWQWGSKVMPTRFAQVEDTPIIVSDTADLTENISLELNTQVFDGTGKFTMQEKRFDAECYTFALSDTSVPATLTSDGQLTITDTSKEFEFEVKVTYTGSYDEYTIWKLVPVKYTPSSIQIIKHTEENGPRTASFLVIDLTDPEDTGTTYSTGEDGTVLFKAVPDHRYVILETAWPDGYHPAVSRQEITAGAQAQTITFTNLKDKEPEPETTPDVVVPGSGDPSGYVYEGIESNRLAGVTATLYQASDESGSDAAAWNAADFDQENPLITDEWGQYLWMVPSGWWQVRYEKAGYDSASSDWMVVPPIRTNVNQNLTSSLPAEIAQMRFSEEAGSVIVTFSRPVTLSSVTEYTVTIGGTDTDAAFSPVDADWSVMEDPADSRICATTFLLQAEPELRGKTVGVTFNRVETYNGIVSEQLSGSTDVAGFQSFTATVIGGTGSGNYSTGTTVTVSANGKECYPFDHWEADGITLADPTEKELRFTMPANAVVLTAVYSDTAVHDFKETITPPSCTEEGYTEYVCRDCGHTEKGNRKDALGHTEVTDKAAAATCTKTGLTQGSHCSACNAVLKAQETIPMTEHSYGDWQESIAATGTEQGQEKRSCTICGKEETRTLPKLSNPFTDVAESDYFFDPVLWAVSKEVTNGTSPTTFSPAANCTRGQIVTFLWRASGSPMPMSSHNPFTDVSPADYFYNAVLWAVEQGITTGTSAATFSPNDSCTRGQAATFLWRANGSPAPASSHNPFTDVSFGEYYYQAVLWAVEKAITNGTSAVTFSPDATCTRGQIVTFLYRAMN